MKKKLTQLEAFKVMIKFLENYYKLTNSDDVGSLLGGMDLSFKGGREPFDPALWDDWVKAVEAVFREASEKDKV